IPVSRTGPSTPASVPAPRDPTLAPAGSPPPLSRRQPHLSSSERNVFQLYGVDGKGRRVVTRHLPRKCRCRAGGGDGRRWLIDHQVLEGDVNSDTPWAALTALVARTCACRRRRRRPTRAPTTVAQEAPFMGTARSSNNTAQRASERWDPVERRAT